MENFILRKLLLLRPTLVGLVFGLGIGLSLGEQHLGVLREAQLQGSIAYLGMVGSLLSSVKVFVSGL